jgi:hypothetical protein
MSAGNLAAEVVHWSSGVLVILSVILLIRIVQRRRWAQRRADDVRWVRAELGRARELIGSNDAREILTGLQMLAVLNDPGERARALPRVVELTQNADERVSSQARATVDRLAKSA